MARVIIIGSGFGGSVAAKRFAEAGWDVTVLEMGERWTDPAKLQQSQDTKYILRMFCDYPADYMFARPKCVVVTGTGWGGGSLVYSKIHLRAKPAAFQAGWPAGYTGANLAPFYSRVETRLDIKPHTDVFKYKRSQVFAQGCCAAGLGAPEANALADTGCQKCGWCVPICKFGKKNTMAKTYLADAEATGRVTPMTNCRVKCITRDPVSGYRVVYWKTDGVTHNYHTVNSGSLYYVTGDKVVIAAGAMESPCILKRSLVDQGWGASFPPLYGFSGSSGIGSGIDGNGDFAVGGFVPQTTDAYKGTIMAASVHGPDWMIEDLWGIPAGPSVKFNSSFYVSDPNRGAGTHTWGIGYKQRLKDYPSKMLAMVLVGKSPSGGNMSVTDNNGLVQLSNTAYQPHAWSYQKAREVVTALGGQLGNTPWEKDGQSVTAHPTGGNAMGTVVQPTNLQVYGNAGVHVIDASVVPHTFVNPVHTIMAVAEKAMDVILGVPGAPTW